MRIFKPNVAMMRDTRNVLGLIKALKDSDIELRRCAANALGKIGDALAVDPLVGVLKDIDATVRSQAVIALAQIIHE
jgi:HEAT repeat protein